MPTKKLMFTIGLTMLGALLCSSLLLTPVQAASTQPRVSLTAVTYLQPQLTQQKLNHATRSLAPYHIIPLNPLVTCTTSDNQTHYADYDTQDFGTIIYRIGYQDTPNNRGYGYCHVEYGHPDATPTVIDYVLSYGYVCGSSQSSENICAVWPGNNKTYNVYIVTSNNAMQDGLMRGIVSAYPTS